MTNLVASHRTASAFDDGVRKLLVLDSLTPDVNQRRDEFSQIVGDEISRIIAEQHELEQRYEYLVVQRSALKGHSNKCSFKEVQREIIIVSDKLRESTKHLCRNLKDNPRIAGSFVQVHQRRRKLITVLKYIAHEVGFILMNSDVCVCSCGRMDHSRLCNNMCSVSSMRRRISRAWRNVNAL